MAVNPRRAARRARASEAVAPMRASRPERAPSTPRVSLLPEQPGIVELTLPARVTTDAWCAAANDAAGVARLAREPARVLVDAAQCAEFDPGVLAAMRAW